MVAKPVLSAPAMLPTPAFGGALGVLIRIGLQEILNETGRRPIYRAAVWIKGRGVCVPVNSSRLGAAETLGRRRGQGALR